LICVHLGINITAERLFYLYLPNELVILKQAGHMEQDGKMRMGIHALNMDKFDSKSTKLGKQCQGRKDSSEHWP